MLILLAKADYTHPNPSPGQQEAGNYAKRKVVWRGLTISIENEKGAVRTGTAGDGTTWSRPMYAAYGYINRTTGVDGDQVDVYLGPDLSAPNVYIVHQRKYGDWDAYDEDKAMLGWPDEASARAAYLKQYDDPRFLGPITEMSAETFVEKVKATKDRPAMLKSVVVLLKGFVRPHLRTVGGKTVQVSGYSTHRNARGEQADLFHPSFKPKVTSSPAFRAWFGDSKVVDEAGQPRVVFHGSSRDFDTFKVSMSGSGSGDASQQALFFSTYAETADHYAAVQGSGYDEKGSRAENEGVVYPVYLRVENPFVSDVQWYSTKDIARDIDRAKAAGHDGVFFPRMTHSGESGTIAVFSPRQVKSASGNSGAFDRESPVMTKAAAILLVHRG